MAKITTQIPSISGVGIHNDLQGLNEGDYLHLTALDKIKFDNIESGAEVNVNTDWNSLGGDSLLLNKPSVFPPSPHIHVISDVTNLQSSLDLKENTSNKQNSLIADGTGTKFPTVDAINAVLPMSFTKVVYVNAVNPNIATIFDLNNPPITNDDLLKTDTNNLYIGTDNTTWTYKTSPAGYNTYSAPPMSNFVIFGTSTDAGSSKTAAISRSGNLSLTSETANTIASFDLNKTIKSLPLATYPSLTELAFVKGLTSNAQTQITARALDNNVVHLSGNETRTAGTLTFKTSLNANANIVINPDNQSIKSLNTSGNTTWQILNTAVSQGGFNMGTSSAYIYGRNGGPLELGASISFIVPNATASTHAINKGQFDAVLLTSVTSVLDFPSTGPGLSSDLTIAYTGAVLGDIVTLGVPFASINANSSYIAFVSATDVVTVRFNNYSIAAINPASGTFKIKILK